MNNTKQDCSEPAAQIKSRERVSTHGEVFTADREVNAMLNLVKQETERIDSRFLEPACGTGNFLVKILERKLSVVRRIYGKSGSDYEFNALMAVSSIYGVDIQKDNVLECRNRLKQIFIEEYRSCQGKDPVDAYLKSIEYIFDRNILWGDALTLKTPDGSSSIIFSEWSALQGKIKRRDYTLDELLRNQPLEGPNLFSDLGDQAFIPKAIQEYPLTHYLKLYEYGKESI